MNERIVSIPLDQVETDSSQPRKHFDRAKLSELAASIKEHGLLQPIMVTRNNNGEIQQAISNILNGGS